MHSHKSPAHASPSQRVAPRLWWRSSSRRRGTHQRPSSPLLRQRTAAILTAGQRQGLQLHAASACVWPCRPAPSWTPKQQPTLPAARQEMAAALRRLAGRRGKSRRRPRQVCLAIAAQICLREPGRWNLVAGRRTLGACPKWLPLLFARCRIPPLVCDASRSTAFFYHEG